MISRDSEAATEEVVTDSKWPSEELSEAKALTGALLHSDAHLSIEWGNSSGEG